MTKTRKLLISLLIVGVAGSVAAFGVFSAFSSTSSNPGNEFQAGTVNIGDNDSGTAIYNSQNAAPGESVTKCIKVTYSGSLDADVKLYVADTVGSLAQYVDLTIQPGNFPGAPPAANACTGFTADGAAIFNNTLQNFRTNHNSWATGLVDNPGSTTEWAAGNSVVYQITASVQSGAPNSAQDTTTDVHAFTWEARNQ
jgi:Camelysin metallo-endopeptidase